MGEPAEMGGLLEREVVVDTRSPYVYLGTLEECSDGFVTLRDVDVHDTTDSRSTKEIYVMNARKFGIQRNRARVKIKLSEMISISLLSDVLVFD